MRDIWESVATNYPAFLVAMLIAGALWLATLLPYRLLTNAGLSLQTFAEEYIYLTFASFLGITVGYLTGMSRVAVTSAVVPAVLTLVGTLIGYLFSSSSTVTGIRQYAVLVSAFALVGSFFIATYAASERRQEWDRYVESFDLYKLQYQSQLKMLEMEYAAKLNLAAQEAQHIGNGTLGAMNAAVQPVGAAKGRQPASPRAAAP